MDLSTILMIAGKPDISELVSQTKGGAIVKNLVTGMKYPVFKNDRISALNDIRIFTTEDDKPLEEVMQDIYNYQKGETLDFDPKKADNGQLFDFFGKVLPNYDTERVHASDVKKVLNWYNILLKADKLTPEEKSEETSEANTETPAETKAETKTEKKAPAKSATAPKKTVAPKTAPKASTQAKAAPKRTTTAKKAI